MIRLREHLQEKYKFKRPNIHPYKNGSFEIVEENGAMYFNDNGYRWMRWDKNTNDEIYQIYAHYDLAFGHCICTGLGFLLRESWLLTNPKVTKITVLEINEKLIEYHKNNNANIMQKIEVVHCNALEYVGECDTLLIDHHEGSLDENEHDFFYSTQIVSKNIKHKVMWFYPLELILDKYYRNYIGMPLKQIYDNIKTYFCLTGLPERTEEQLFEYCRVFFSGRFIKCNFIREN